MKWDDCLDENKIPTLRCIPIAITNVVYGVLALAGIAATILLIFSGIRLVLSGGDQLRVAQARKTATYAIIGLVIILSSFFLLNLVTKVLDFSPKL